MNSNAYMRVFMKARADRWREAGCCTSCGVEVEKFKRCRACREARAKQAQKARRIGGQAQKQRAA